MSHLTLYTSIVFISLFFIGCFDFPEQCGMDFEKTEYELWNLEVFNSSFSKSHTWNTKSSNNGYSSNYKFYGVTPDKKYLYYTDSNSISYLNLYKLDLNLDEVTKIQIESDAKDYTLSPSGEFAAYQKRSKVWISDTKGNSKYMLPRSDSLQYFGSPKWYVDVDRLLINGASTYSKAGLWLVNLKDSSYSRISFDKNVTKYDLSCNGSKIVVQDNESSDSPIIKYKNIFSDDLLTLSVGHSPKFVNEGKSILFERSNDVYISSLSGKTKR